MIYGFDNPHPLGTICRMPCKYCGEDENTVGYMTGDEHGQPIEPVPMMIMRIATREEYIKFCRENSSDHSEPRGNFGPYFYEVSLD